MNVARDAEHVMEAARVVAHHQVDVAAGVDEWCRYLEERSSVLDQRHQLLVSRLERAELGLRRLEEVLPRRNLRIATLRDQLTGLRNGAAPHMEPERNARVTRAERLGTALIYAGGLLLVWLVLWQLGLAFGLR